MKNHNVPLGVIIGITAVLFGLIGCSTSKDVTRTSLNRFVKNDRYINPLKKYSFKWPNPSFWKYQNFPEFDASFDHLDGNAQIFIIGVKPLIRRTFPDGFVEWLLNRLRVKDSTINSRQEVTGKAWKEFQIFLNAKFNLLARENFSVERKAAIFCYSTEKDWVGLIYLSPDNSFDAYYDQVMEIASSLEILKD